MVTNYPHPIASQQDMTTAATHAEGFGGRRVIDRLRQVVCGLHGHDALVQFEQDRMFLRCVSCGHETPGWELSEASRNASAAPEATRERSLARAQLIGERRIA